MHSFEKVYENKDKGDTVTPFLSIPIKKIGTFKYDGAAIALEYQDGKLVQAFTKGRKGVGQTALEHIRMIGKVPENIKL